MNTRQQAGGVGTTLGIGTLTYIFGHWGLVVGIIAAVWLWLPRVLAALPPVTSMLMVVLPFVERRWLFDDEDRTNRANAYDHGVPLPPRPRPRTPELTSPPEPKPPSDAPPLPRPRPGPRAARSRPRPREGP